MIHCGQLKERALISTCVHLAQVYIYFYSLQSLSTCCFFRQEILWTLSLTTTVYYPNPYPDKPLTEMKNTSIT